VLGLLTVVYALNFLDRTIFNVLIEPIKKEFALSDTTMGRRDRPRRAAVRVRCGVRPRGYQAGRVACTQ
jgi:hypothetical protein